MTPVTDGCMSHTLTLIKINYVWPNLQLTGCHFHRGERIVTNFVSQNNVKKHLRVNFKGDWCRGRLRVKISRILVCGELCRPLQQYTRGRVCSYLSLLIPDTSSRSSSHSSIIAYNSSHVTFLLIIALLWK